MARGRNFRLDTRKGTARGLVGLWGPGPPGGPFLYDESGWRNDGILTSMQLDEWLFDPERGWVLEFVRTGEEYVDTGYLPDSSQITLSLWGRWGDVTPSNEAAIGCHDGSNRTYLGIDEIGNFFVGMGDSFIGAGTGNVAHNMSADTWYHLAVTGDNTTARVYLNSVQAASFAYSTSAPSTDPFWIGARSGINLFMDAQFGDVRIYNRPYSPAEIQHIYQKTRAVPYFDIAMKPSRVFKAAAAPSFQVAWADRVNQHIGLGV